MVAYWSLSLCSVSTKCYCIQPSRSSRSSSCSAHRASIASLKSKLALLRLLRTADKAFGPNDSWRPCSPVRVTSVQNEECERLPDTLATRQFGIKTLWDTSAPISRHFDTSAVIEEKPGDFDPRQFRWDTAPPVIRLKLRHQFCGAELSRCRSVLWPKCPAPVQAASTGISTSR